MRRVLCVEGKHFRALVVHSGAPSLGWWMRRLFGKGTPRTLQVSPSHYCAGERFPMPLVRPSDDSREIRRSVAWP
jgi:hypothetical protein